MILAAVRYALGSDSYLPSVCTSWLMKWWDLLEDMTREGIVREVALQGKGDMWLVFGSWAWMRLPKLRQEWVKAQVGQVPWA